jgi:hypothetical protein
LIVNQTPENQEAIDKLLGQLREARAVQISVEGRVCLLTEGLYGNLARAYPTMVQQGKRAVLDNQGLKEVLAEVQGDAESAEVTMPRLTLFNGQMGWMGAGEKGEGKWGFVQAIEAAATRDRKGAVVHMKLGVPADVREEGKGRREVDVLAAMPDRETLMVDGGMTVNEKGEGRRVVWLMRPALIVQREVEEGEK